MKLKINVQISMTTIYNTIIKRMNHRLSKILKDFGNGKLFGAIEADIQVRDEYKDSFF